MYYCCIPLVLAYNTIEDVAQCHCMTMRYNIVDNCCLRRNIVFSMR